jgi:transcription antitermination factor NusG
MNPIRPAKHWYVLAIHPGFANLIQYKLRRMGIEVYVPKAPLPERKGREKREKSLFPGYIFCRLSIQDQKAISLTAGAIGLLGIPMPAPCSDDDISTLRKALHSRLPVQALPFVQRNKHVSVVKGPLRGLRGFVLNRQGGPYFAIPIKALKCTLAFKLGHSSIQSLQKPSESVGPVSVQFRKQRRRRSNPK